MKLTADTITDEQIRELLLDYFHAKPWPDSYGVDLCDEALGRQSRYAQQPIRPDAAAIRKARARCAEILNAREGDAFQRTTKAIDDVIADTSDAIEQRAKRST